MPGCKTDATHKAFKRCILIAVFIAGIYLPFLFTFVSMGEDVSKSEKRKKHPVPRIKSVRYFIQQFPDEFNKFLRDHFGFRQTFVSINNYIRIKIFNCSPEDLVIVGKKGWFFYTGEENTEDFTGRARFSQRELDLWENALFYRKNWLEQRNIHYLLVIAPNKQTVYPEYMPERFLKRRGETRCDQLLSSLDKAGFASYLDLREPLRARRKNGLLYNVTGTHWNSKGAFEAYLQMIKRVKTWYGFVQPLEPPAVKFSVSKGDSGKDMAELLGLSGVIREKTHPDVALMHGCAEDIEEVKLPYVGDKWFEKPFVKGCKQKKLHAVVFRDSFFHAVEPFFSEHFKQVVYIWKSYDQEIMEQLLDVFAVDVVLEERVERLLIRVPEEPHE